jgi:hypothetical protein
MDVRTGVESRDGQAGADGLVIAAG